MYKHFNQLSLLTANQSQSEIQRDQPASVSLLENIPHVNRCSCLSSLLPYHSDNNNTVKKTVGISKVTGSDFDTLASI